MTLTLDTTTPTMTDGAAPTPALVTPPAPVVTGRRRLELVETIDAQRAEIEQLRADLRRAEYGQITDGGDSRLTAFWEAAMEIATAKSFCEQYDIIAEEMGGPRREKEFTVSLEVSATVTVYVNATGHDEEAAVRRRRSRRCRSRRTLSGSVFGSDEPCREHAVGGSGRGDGDFHPPA